MEFVIITGLSGGGKSKAASFMEDMGYFCVDNLPISLISKFAELCMAGIGEYSRVVLVTDIRAGNTFDRLFQALEELKQLGIQYKILFMEADDAVIIRRYKESRRSHPLESQSDTLSQAILMERQMLEPLRNCADYIINSSTLSTSQLRQELIDRFIRETDKKHQMKVHINSFGFKNGLPMDADLVFDVRFLPNPFYISDLRPMTGLDKSVYDYVFSSSVAQEFFSKLKDLVLWLLPNYVEEGKTSLVISIGCTGGHHRSVAFAHALAEFLKHKDYIIIENHRDLSRG